MNAVVEECHLKKGPGYDYKFVEINITYKKKIRKGNFDAEYKNKTICELLNFQSNRKFRNEKRNKELLDNILANNNNDNFNNIISKKYIDIFKEVYYKNKKDINYEGLNLNLQKTFDGYFLDKIHAKEGYYKEKIDEIIGKLYFPKKLLFEVKKNCGLDDKNSHGNGKNPLINGYGNNNEIK